MLVLALLFRNVIRELFSRVLKLKVGRVPMFNDLKKLLSNLHAHGAKYATVRCYAVSSSGRPRLRNLEAFRRRPTSSAPSPDVEWDWRMPTKCCLAAQRFFPITRVAFPHCLPNKFRYSRILPASVGMERFPQFIVAVQISACPCPHGYRTSKFWTANDGCYLCDGDAKRREGE